MATTFIPFDGWTPSGSYFGEGWNSAFNLFPAYSDWRPWRKFISPPSTSSVVDGPMIGRHVHFWSSGLGTADYLPDNPTIFAGSPAHLYEVSQFTGVFTDRSRAALYTPNNAGWRFDSIGNDIWACNWVDPMQRRTGNAGLFANGVTSTFKPVPRFLAPVREHQVVANLNQTGRFYDEVAWSDADDATNFDPPAGGSTSLSIAGSKRLVSIPGQITGLVGGQYGLAFKRACIFYLEYTGDTQVFRPDVLSSNVGTAFPSSIIDSRYGVFFLGPDGFYQIQGLAAPVKISPPGVDQYLTFSALYQVPPILTWQEDIQVEGFRFGPAPLIGWIFRYNWADHGNNLAILFNPATNAWAQVQVAGTDDLAELLGPKVTAVLDLPNGNSQLAALTWDNTASRYAALEWEGVGSTVWPPSLSLNFRPANVDGSKRAGQSRLNWVLPTFSKWDVNGAPLSATVTVEAMLDPFLGTYGAPTVMPPANRDRISGVYPIQLAGRFFRITIDCADEDFASFEGVWVDEDQLSP